MKATCAARCLLIGTSVIAVTLLAAAGFAAEEPPLVKVTPLVQRAIAPDAIRLQLEPARAGVVITAASAQLSGVDIPPIALNDRGVDGDTAGDGRWTMAFPVPADYPPGEYWFYFDAQLTVDGRPQTAKVGIDVRVGGGPNWAVKVLSPRAGAEVAGALVVEAQVGSRIPLGTVLARIGTSSVETKREGGVWRATVDTLKCGNGKQQVMVLASAAGVGAKPGVVSLGPLVGHAAGSWAAEVPVTVRNAYNWYWGDTHGHSGYSADSGYAPVDAYTKARDRAHLDFYCLTDHDNNLTIAEYADSKRTADALDAPGKFVAFYGVEWTGRVGHICVLMPDDFRFSGELNAAFRELAEQGVTAHFNHPEYGSRLEGYHYSPQGDAAIFGVEVRRPGEEAAYIEMLNNGWHLGADGSEDTHGGTWGMGPTWTVALARELTREGILSAMRARRIYSTHDRNLRLDYVLDGEDMGAQVARPAGLYSFVVNVTDPDDKDVIARIDAILDGKVIASATPAVNAYRWSRSVEFKPGRHYLYMRVTEADGNLAYSSPVWVEAYELPPARVRQ